ncbi:MAG: enoyl-CoA hydratase [Comamonadaceae bacterium]|nr:MAG: enoyl-CoA hydratase [Comamonadaceae bacterium]
MTSSLVQYRVDEHGIATLTLDDPVRMNPLTMPLFEQCLDALDRVRADRSVHALVLAAHGRGFCSGADLRALDQSLSGERAADAPTPGEDIARLMEEGGNRLILALRELPVPVVCAMHGAAAGGGVGVVLACDVIVAARSAYFYLPFAPALGLVPDMGATWFLSRTAGDARTSGLTLLGDRLTAEQAERWGVIWSCVDDAALPIEVQKTAQRLAALPAGAIAEQRALMAHARTASLAEQLDYERLRQRKLIDEPDFAEGVRAFVQRRAPRFSRR